MCQHDHGGLRGLRPPALPTIRTTFLGAAVVILAAPTPRPIYLAEREHRVTALDLVTGAVIWSVDVDPNTTSPVRTWATLPVGDTVYVAARECGDANCSQTRGLVLALARADGKTLWRYLTPETSMDAFALALSGRHLVVSDLLGEGLYAIDRFSAQRAWRVRGEPHWIGPQAPATVVGDTAYFGMQDQTVYAVHVPTGTVIWKTKVTGGVDGVTACGASLFATHLGLTKLDRATGRILGTRGTGGDPEFPTTKGGAAAGDRIIVGGDHALYAYACTH